jgi:hypothetical protein
MGAGERKSLLSTPQRQSILYFSARAAALSMNPLWPEHAPTGQ